MYQGKYLADKKPGKAPKAAPARSTQRPAAPARPAERPAAPAERPAAPVAAPARPQSKPQKRRKGVTVGTVIFYFLYILLIVAAVFAIRYTMGLLEDWLIRFEASQPDTKSQEFFDELFADPDWGHIYTLAGLEDTEFEGKEAYTAYMQEKLGGRKLTYTKTSAGLTGGHKYIVKLDEEKVATFTIHDSTTGELDIPEWYLGKVEAGFFTRTEDVTVTTQSGRTVTLNGIPLDESYVVKTTSTAVESYLPEGIHGPYTTTVYASGFLVEPEVLVIDSEGQLVEMHYDPETATYTEAAAVTQEQPIPDEEKEALVEATKGYSRYMIGASATLSKYFDTSTDIYKAVLARELFFKGYSSYGFTEPVVSEYHRYTDDLFSARIQLTLNTYRADGSVKPFELNSNIFMTKSAKKGWVISDITNVDIHEVETLVRITWMQDGNVLSSAMVDASNSILTPPAVTVPQGKVFAGWYKETLESNGDTTLSLVFAPTESGAISLPSDYVLEPMVLQARFEDEGA